MKWGENKAGAKLEVLRLAKSNLMILTAPRTSLSLLLSALMMTWMVLLHPPWLLHLLLLSDIVIVSSMAWSRAKENVVGLLVV